MGRNENRPPSDYEGKVRVRRHKLNSGGYDSIGAYFGLGPKLWFVESVDTEFYWYIRAVSFAEAKRLTRVAFPKARVR